MRSPDITVTSWFQGSENVLYSSLYSLNEYVRPLKCVVHQNDLEMKINDNFYGEVL
jgi:hypothetical protein